MNVTKFLHDESWVVVFAALLLGFFIPKSGLWLGPYVAYLLMILIMISVLDVKYREILKQMHKVRIVSISLLIIHLLGPLIILFLKPWLEPQLFLGLILASTIPSGLSVIFFAKLFRGNPSEALVITILSNVLAPIVVPLVVYIFAREIVNVDFISMAITIIKIVIIPLVLARLIRPTKLAKVLRKQSTTIAMFMLFLIILGLIAPLKSTIEADISKSIQIAIIVGVLIILSTIIGFILGKNKAERRTLLISCSYKNYTLATVTALALFEPIVALPAIMYAVMNNVILLPVQLFFKNRK